MNKKTKRISIIVLCVVLGVGGVFFIGLSSMLREFSKEVSRIEILNVDLSKVDDGSYPGEFNFNDSVGASVLVSVEGGRIINIEILNHNSSGIGKKAEAITNSVIEKQSLEVETISGATGSSTIILKAIESALNN